MDANIIPGSRLQQLIEKVMPPTLPTHQAPPDAPPPRDVVDVGRLYAPEAPAQPKGFASFAPTEAPAPPAPAPAQPKGFASFAAPAAPTAPTHNPTVLTMEEPAQQAPVIDERKSPVEQAHDLNAHLLGRIVDVSRRTSALSTAEVGEHMALMGWAFDKLESLSARLEGEGKTKENDYVEGIQRDLAQAIQSFAQIHQGSINSVQSAAYYRMMSNMQIDQTVAQTNMMMAQRRNDVIGYAMSMRGSGVQAGMGAPGMMPGAPGMMPGAPGMMPGAPGMMPGAPGMMPGAPGMMPGQVGMMPGQVAPGMMPGQVGVMPGQVGMMPGQTMMNVGGPVAGPGSPGWGMQPGMAPLNIGGPVAGPGSPGWGYPQGAMMAPGAAGWATPYPTGYYGR